MLLVCTMVIAPFSLLGGVSAASTADNEPLKIEVTTDKSSYSAFGIAKITVTVTNTSDEAIENISAEAIFEQLAPVDKSSETYKEVYSLESGESFEFTYKATVNSSNVNLNFFEKIILWFVRLFNGGFNATENNFDDGRESIEKSYTVKYGSYETTNHITIWFLENDNKISDQDFNIFQNIRKSIENISKKEQVIEIIESEINKGNITDYQVGETYITFKTTSGIQGIWEDETFFVDGNKSVSLHDKANITSNTPSGNTYQEIIEIVSSQKTISPIGDVAVFRPYRSTEFTYDDFLTTGEIIADTLGKEIDVFDDANATLSVLENLDEYGVVLIDSHGSLIDNEPYICLTQSYNNQEISLDDLDSLFINQDNSIRVKATFFENNYIDNEFDDCLIFLGTCYSMYDTSFSNTLIEKGVDCVYGYTNTVSVGYCNDTLVETMLENLLIGKLSSSGSYNKTILLCGQTDPHNSATNFVTQQSSDFYLLPQGYLRTAVAYSDGTVAENAKVFAYLKSEKDNPDKKVYTYTPLETESFTVTLPVGEYIVEYVCGTQKIYKNIIIEKDITSVIPIVYFSKELEDIGGNKGYFTTTVAYTDGTTPNNAEVLIYLKSEKDNADKKVYSYTPIEGAAIKATLPVGEYVVEYVCGSQKQFKEIIIENGETVNIPVVYFEKDGGNEEDDTGDYGTLTQTGSCGDNVFYDFYEDTGTLVIRGSGAMEGNYYNQPWSDWRNKIIDVVIKNGVTSIGSAFSYCDSLANVILPNSVTYISSEAFYGCTSLASITIPETVTQIGSKAFGYCKSLQNINIPDNVEYIDDYAFDGCENLTKITVGKNNKNFSCDESGILYNKDKTVLIYCPNIASVKISDTVTEIYKNAFLNGNGIKELEIPAPIYKSDYANSYSYKYDYLEAFNKCNSIEKLIVTKGSGKMECYDDSDYPWHYSRSKIKEIVLEEGIKNISEDAFSGCTSITSIIIPNSVKIIGDSAFYGCTSLASVIFEDNSQLTTTGNCAFTGCTSLANVLWGKNSQLTDIGYSTFSGCTSLADITIPESVTTIGEGAFHNTAYYNNSDNWIDHILYIDNCLISAEDDIKDKCNIVTGTRIIASYAFFGCDFSEVIIPNSVIYINDSAFSNGSTPYNSLITKISVGNGVVEIGDNAFYNCNFLSEIYLGDNVEKLGEDALFDCHAKITVSENNKNYSNDEYRVLFNKDKTVLIHGSVSKSYVIPETVIQIEDYAFSGCTSLTSVTIPNSVTSIGSHAFSNCTSFTSITIPNSVTSIGDYAFSNCDSLTSVTIPDSVTNIVYATFSNCDSLTSVTIGNGVTSIGDEAFYHCDSLTSVTIPNSVTSIGGYTFEDCTSLTSITIPDSVTSIGRYAFQGTAYYNNEANWENGVLYLENHLIEAKNDISGVYIIKSGTLTIGGYAFSNCDSLTSVTIPDSVTIIGDCAFEFCYSLTSVTIGNGVTSIGDEAFYRCDSLTSVTIPDSVTSIGDHAFYYCESLTRVTIGNSVKSVGRDAFHGTAYYDNEANYQNGVLYLGNHLIKAKYYISGGYTIKAGTLTIADNAFYSCNSLTSITIPDSVTRIGSYTFEDCKSLTSINVSANNKYYSSQDGVLFNKDKTELIQYPIGNARTSYTIPDSVTSIDDKAFYHCSDLTNITIGSGVISIGDYAFSNCNSLTSITIGSRVISIGDYSFSNCNSLTSITIPDNVTNIGDNAFYSCDSLTSITIPDSVTSIENSFFSCDNLNDVYYAGTKEQWNEISIRFSDITLFIATIHYNS